MDSSIPRLVVIVEVSELSNFYDLFLQKFSNWSNSLDHVLWFCSGSTRFAKVHLSQLMRLWYFSSSVNSFFNAHAQPSSWARCLIFDQALRLLPYFMCVNSKGLARLRRCADSLEPSLVASVISAIISWAGSFHGMLGMKWPKIRQTNIIILSFLDG